VDLHDVNLLPPQTLLRLAEAAQGVTFVTQVFACRPDLICEEDPITDAERRRKVANADFTGTVEWRRVDDGAVANTVGIVWRDLRCDEVI